MLIVVLQIFKLFFCAVVCVQFLTKFKKRLTDNEVGSTQGDIELELFKACKDAIGKEERLVSSLVVKGMKSH